MAEAEVSSRCERLPSIALHIAGFLTLFSAILAVNSIIDVSSFGAITAIVAAAGNAISWLLRKRGYSIRLLEIVVIGVVVIIYARVATGNYASELLMPSAADGAMELKLAVMLLWMEVLRSFTLTTDYAVVFTAVPALALLGLMATENINPEMLLFFVMYLICAVFMLVQRSSDEVGHVCGDEKRLLWEQIRAALAVGAIAMVAGTIAVTPVRVVATGIFSKAAPGWLRPGPRPGLQNLAEPGMLPIAQGPVRLSSATVMIVRSNPPGKLMARRYPYYWRGRVFDRYTGHGWSNNILFSSVAPSRRYDRPVVYSDSNGNMYRQFESPKPPKVYSGEVELLFEITRPTFDVVYAASEPVKFRAAAAYVWRDSENNWRVRLGGGFPVRYEITSAIPEQDPVKLRSITTDQYPQDIVERYTQSTNNTVHARELALQLTEHLKNPYDKAEKIAEYLATNYTYDINAAPAPLNTDAVEYFLFNSRTGYCDVFASSMVVMLRELHIPSRLATGYAEGTYDPSVHGYRVRELDRHAWVEVYFGKYGWIPFDPTGGSTSNDTSWLNGLLRTMSDSMRLLTSSGMVTLAVLLVLLTLALFVISSGGSLPFLSRRIPRTAYSSPSRAHTRAVREFMSLCRYLEKISTKRQIYETPREFAHAASESLGNPDAADIVQKIVERFNAIRYGQDAVGDVELQELRSDIRSVRMRHRRRN